MLQWQQIQESAFKGVRYWVRIQVSALIPKRDFEEIEVKVDNVFMKAQKPVSFDAKFD